MIVPVTEKQEWLDLLLQHAVPETVARSCIRDVTDEAQLIAKIKALESPGEGVERLLQVLSFPVRDKRPWLNVLLSHGFPAEPSKAFLLGIPNGDLLYLEQTLLKHRPDLAETLTSKVCGEGWGGRGGESGAAGEGGARAFPSAHIPHTFPPTAVPSSGALGVRVLGWWV